MPEIIRIRFLLVFILTFSSATLIAQQPEAYRSDLKPYFEALELYSRGHYEPARKGFDDYLVDQNSEYSEYQVNASYYRAASAMALFHKDAEYLMEEFIRKHPESLWIQPAYLSLANYNFNRRDYDDAIYFFQQLDFRELNPDQEEEVTFKIGFSAFELEDFETAKTSFFKLKDNEGVYYGPTNYYYGHIAYTEGNYQTALESFQKAQSDENFSPVVPYYIAQIYHYQKKYDDLIAYAEPLMDSEDIQREEEMALLLANAYYENKKYAEAIPYFEVYMARNYNPEPSQAYQLAYSYYHTGEFQKSLDFFAKASKADSDKLVQIATYQMADAYVKLGEKKYAQNAFKVASQMDVDPEITEDALFNYAKLAYELSYDPFHEAIQAFEKYLQTYPNSQRKDEAFEFLLKVHLATKNYEAAIQALDKMRTLGPVERAQYQKSAYNWAAEELQKQQNDPAMKHFELSKKYPEDPQLVALADYWIGDIHYRDGDYDKAVRAYQRFLNNTSAYRTDFYNTANYNIGYSRFKEKKYDEALTAFRKYIAGSDLDPKRKNDAYLRIGDLNLVSKNYSAAIESYSAAADGEGVNEDYAFFQKAMAEGYRENHKEKISILKKLLEKHPETSLAAVARYELGDSYFTINELNPALDAFNKVIKDHPQSPYRKKSLLKRGLVQYRLGMYDDAIASYKTVVDEYGVDAESQEAVATLKNIYLDLGRIDEFTAWLNQVPDYEVSPSEIDSLTYQAAENLVAEGNCDKGIEAFEKYLRQFPGGLFATNAHYYMGDCAFRKNNYDKALVSFEYVVEHPSGQFTEPALLGAAEIRFQRKDYQKAREHYRKLEGIATFPSNALQAQIGQMRTNYQLGDYQNALAAIEKMLKNETGSKDILLEARLNRARIYFSEKRYDDASADYKWLVDNSKGKEGAEAKYRLAQIDYLNGKLDLAEAGVFELVKQYPSYNYWKVKGFILLADIYAEKKDFFQAEATLKSVIQNVTDQGLKREAEAKLEAIRNRESQLIQAGDTLPKADTLDFEDEYEGLIEEDSK